MQEQALSIAEIESVAKEIARVIGEGDLDGLRRLMTPDAVVWHNIDNKERSVDETVEFVKGLLEYSSRRWFENVRLTPTPTGYIDRHDMYIVTSDGQELCNPICMVVTVEGGRVRRMEEYFDSEAMGAKKAESARLKAVANREFEEVVNGRRPDLAAEIHHPQLKIGRMGIQKAAEYLVRRQGGDPSFSYNIMGAALHAAFPDFHLKVVGPQISEGDLVVTRIIFTGTHKGDFFGAPPTNRKIEFDEVLFMRMTDGKISEVWALGDELSFLQQLGVLPE